MSSANTNESLLGFDHGERHIGVAIGQLITATAAPLGSLKAENGQPNWQHVEALINEWQPTKVVVGLPLNMDGTEQPVTKAAKKFGQRIHGRFGINVVFHDERMTTVDAKSRLFELGGFKRLTKQQVDSVSAVLILESYMEQSFGE